MKVGDLVVATDYEWRDCGVGIIIGFGGDMQFVFFLKVFWSKQGVWCYTGTRGVKLL